MLAISLLSYNGVIVWLIEQFGQLNLFVKAATKATEKD